MARDDRLKKAQSAGVDFIETARVKAEEFLKELARTGGDTQSALDDLVAGGRRTGEQLVTAISKEIRNQVNALGLVTKIDLQAFEARLGRRAPAARSAAAKATSTAQSAAAPTTAQKAPAPKKAASKAAAPKKAAPKKVAAKAAAAPASAKKAAGQARKVSAGGATGAAKTPARKAATTAKKATKKAAKKAAG